MRTFVRKLVIALITAWVTITATFILPRLMPGNPIEQLIGKLTGRVTPEEIAAIKAQFGQGLNEPVIVQYWHYLVNLFHGDLGTSITYSPQSVSSVIFGQLWWTLGLIGTATVLSFILGTALGVYFGWTRGARTDLFIPVAGFLQSTPFYVLGTLLVMIFAFRLHWFPFEGSYDATTVSPGWNWAFIASVLRYAQLPLASIVLCSLSGWMIGMRNMMVTTMSEDFVLMAVAKGLPKRKVMWHAARNAVLPQIANLTLAIGLLVSGALIVEQVFSYQGVGGLLVNAVSNLDYPLIQGIFLVITFTVLIMSAVGDVLYVWLDPRTRTATVE